MTTISNGSVERLKVEKKNLTKQLLSQEVKRSNNTVEKIKRGHTIFEEEDFRKTFQMKNDNAL